METSCKILGRADKRVELVVIARVHTVHGGEHAPGAAETASAQQRDREENIGWLHDGR